jgi:hypothetical protein
VAAHMSCCCLIHGRWRAGKPSQSIAGLAGGKPGTDMVGTCCVGAALHGLQACVTPLAEAPTCVLQRRHPPPPGHFSGRSSARCRCWPSDPLSSALHAAEKITWDCQGAGAWQILAVCTRPQGWSTVTCCVGRHHLTSFWSSVAGHPLLPCHTLASCMAYTAAAGGPMHTQDACRTQLAAVEEPIFIQHPCQIQLLGVPALTAHPGFDSLGACGASAGRCRRCCCWARGRGCRWLGRRGTCWGALASWRWVGPHAAACGS